MDEKRKWDFVSEHRVRRSRYWWS